MRALQVCCLTPGPRFSTFVAMIVTLTLDSNETCRHFPLTIWLAPITENQPDVTRHAKSWNCECRGLKDCLREKPTKRNLEKIVPANSVELLGRGDPGDPINWRYDGWFSLCADPLWGSCNDLPWRQAQCCTSEPYSQRWRNEVC